VEKDAAHEDCIVKSSVMYNVSKNWALSWKNHALLITKKWNYLVSNRYWVTDDYNWIIKHFQLWLSNYLSWNIINDKKYTFRGILMYLVSVSYLWYFFCFIPLIGFLVPDFVPCCTHITGETSNKVNYQLVTSSKVKRVSYKWTGNVASYSLWLE